MDRIYFTIIGNFFLFPYNVYNPNIELFMKNISNKSNSNKNLGIQIFRAFLCFLVILDHCLKKRLKFYYSNFLGIRLHVPSFILISFFYSFRTFTKRNISKIKQRFERLLVPYFIFPILILLINNSFLTFWKFGFFGKIITLKDLIIQFIIGNKFILVFWFQFFLIWTTLLFIIISFLSKEKYLVILEQICILSYYLKYSKLNYTFFNQFKNVIRHNIGQFLEVLPLAISGSVIAHFDLFQIIKKYYKNSIYLSFVCLFFLNRYNLFSKEVKIGFGGIVTNIYSILSFIIFFLLPINTINDSILYKIIYRLTNYTQGIYSFHIYTKLALNSKIDSIKNKSFLGCILIYIFSYFISFIGEKLTKKTKLVYLFI